MRGLMIGEIRPVRSHRLTKPGQHALEGIERLRAGDKRGEPDARRLRDRVFREDRPAIWFSRWRNSRRSITSSNGGLRLRYLNWISALPLVQSASGQ